MENLLVYHILNVIYLHINDFPSTCAVPSMAAVHTYCMLCKLLRYFLNILENFWVIPTIITFKFHTSCNTNKNSFLFQNFSASFLNLCLLKLPCLWTNVLHSHYTDRDIRFNVTHFSVRFHLFIPWCGYLSFMSCSFNQFR